MHDTTNDKKGWILFVAGLETFSSSRSADFSCCVLSNHGSTKPGNLAERVSTVVALYFASGSVELSCCSGWRSPSILSRTLMKPRQSRVYSSSPQGQLVRSHVFPLSFICTHICICSRTYICGLRICFVEGKPQAFALQIERRYLLNKASLFLLTIVFQHGRGVVGDACRSWTDDRPTWTTRAERGGRKWGRP